MFHSFFPLFVHAHLLLEVEDVDSDESGKAYEYGVNQIEIESSGGINPVSGGYAEACGTKGRHDGCGYGYAWDYVTASLSGAAQGHDAGQSAE